MSRDDRYRVGIYADWHNPDSITNYKAKIVNGTTFIMLPQYPSPNHRFIIKDFIEVGNREDIIKENEFWVDYTEGFVYFHPSLQDTWITIKEFYGIGINRIDAKRVVTKLDATGNVVQVLQDIIDAYKEIFEALANAMQLVKDVQHSLEVLESTQNPVFIVAKDQWTQYTEGGITKYKTTINHNLLSKNLHITAIDIATDMNMGSPPFKTIDFDNIEVYSFEVEDIKYVISAGYYNGLIDNDRTNEILTELYDARLGEPTLKDKIRDMDSQLITEIDNVNASLEHIVQGLKSTYKHTVSEMVGISNPLNPSEELLIKIRDCGFKYYRVDLLWQNIETVQGTYNFQNSTFDYDNLNTLLKKYNLTPYYILGYSNTLYGNEGNITTEAMINGYTNYVKACVNRYKNQNCVWEIYNEPNTNSWKNSSPKKYTNLVKTIYPIIKNIDTTSVVAVGALGNTLSYSLEFFDKMCNYGVLDYCDIITTHPYSNEKPELLNDYWGKFYGIIGKYTNRNIPIWCGEIGYSDVPNWDGNGNNAVVNTTNKINYTLRQILNNIRNGIEKTIIYCATDRNGSNSNVENYFGIFDYSGNYKDVSNAIKALLNDIGDYYFIEELETNNINNYVMKFTNGINVKYVAWTTNNKSKIILENNEYIITEKPRVFLSINNNIQINKADNDYLKSKYSAIAISDKNLNSYKDEVNSRLEIIDKTGSPGSCYLKSGTKENGFFGLVSPVEMGRLNNGDLFNGVNLSAKVGISEGVAVNPNCPLMKFIIDGKILFIPLKPYRYNIYWDTIYNNGCVFGTTDEGYCPKGSRSGKDLYINASDNSINTTSQKFNSYVKVGDVGDTIKLDGWKNSNNNTTATIVSISDTKIVVSGATLTSEEGNINSRISNLKYNVNQNKDVEIGNYTYRVRLIKTGDLVLNSFSDDYRGTISDKNEWNRLILPLHEKCITGWSYTQYAKDSNLKDIKYQYANLSDIDLNTINSLNGSYTWTQNTSDKESWKRAFRGALGAEFINVENENNRNNGMAWRPVLELIK